MTWRCCTGLLVAATVVLVLFAHAAAHRLRRRRRPADRRVTPTANTRGADHGRGRPGRGAALRRAVRRTRRVVGADYVEQLAKVRRGRSREPADVGILADADALDGPGSRARVTRLIREFYEHTSRFKLSIVPRVGGPRMKPAYALFKAAVAEPLGQATILSTSRIPQRGMVSDDRRTTYGSDAIDVTRRCDLTRTRSSRSTSASTPASATRTGTSASASRSRLDFPPPRWSRATSTATACC